MQVDFFGAGLLNIRIVLVAGSLAAIMLVAACGEEPAETKSRKISSVAKKTEVLPLLEDPNPATYKPEKPPVSFEDYLQAAERAADCFAYQDGIVFARKAVELRPRSGYAHALLGKIMLSVVNENDDRALVELRKAVELGYEGGKLYEDMATVYVQRKDYTNALKALDRAIELMPRHRTLYKFRAGVHVDAGDLKSAQTDYDSLIRISVQAKKGHAYITRGRFFESFKRYDEAISDYTSAIRFSRTKRDGLKMRSALLLETGKKRKALEDLNAILEITPKDDDARKTRGDIYMELGENEKAMADFNRVIESFPEFASHALKSRARLYDKLGKSELAREDRKRAKRLSESPAEKPVFDYKN